MAYMVRYVWISYDIIYIYILVTDNFKVCGEVHGEMVGEWVVKHQTIDNCLVVWNMAFTFPYVGNVIIPTDELHHFSEG